jgi:hypothetical protein
MSYLTSSTWWSDMGDIGLTAGGVGMVFLPIEFAAAQVLPGNRAVQLGLGVAMLVTTGMAAYGKYKKLGH